MSASPTEILAVLFDADGVVQSSQAGWLERLGQLTGSAKHTEQFLADVFEAEQPSLTGVGDFAESLAQVLDKWASTVSVAQALQMWTMIEPDQGVLEIIAGIRLGGTQVALATNQQSYRLEYMLNELDYKACFDHILCSCELGFAKPAPEYYRSAIEAIGIRPENLLFIDDHSDNVRAASMAGLNAEKYHMSEGKPAMIELLVNYGVPID